MRKLIINADDFGFNREITEGIAKCHETGAVRSTTLMVNMPAAEYAASLISKYPGLSVGIHLNLTLGKPVSPPERVKSLLDRNGFFHDKSEMFKRAFRFRLDSREIAIELTAQIERFVAFGFVPTHADSHHHVADCPQIFPVKTSVLAAHGIRRIRTQRGWYRRDRIRRGLSAWCGAVRMNVLRSPARLYYEVAHWYGRRRGFLLPNERFGFQKVVVNASCGTLGISDLTDFESMIRNCPLGISECVVHPGLLSDDPLDCPKYRHQRQAEYDLLTNTECVRICSRHGVHLTNFFELSVDGPFAHG